MACERAAHGEMRALRCESGARRTGCSLLPVACCSSVQTHASEGGREGVRVPSRRGAPRRHKGLGGKRLLCVGEEIN